MYILLENRKSISLRRVEYFSARKYAARTKCTLYLKEPRPYVLYKLVEFP